MHRKGLTPQGYHISPIAGKVHYQSSYERKFMEYLDNKNINWTRCKERFPYIDLEGKKHTYNPDIYLPEDELYIEIKGMIRLNDPLKFEAFPKDKKLLLVGVKELKQLGLDAFDPMSDISQEKLNDTSRWPHKLLAQMPDYAKRGELSEDLKKRLLEYFYIIKK